MRNYPKNINELVKAGVLDSDFDPDRVYFASINLRPNIKKKKVKNMDANFQNITDRLAEILEQKNKAYGNSYDSTLDKWGMSALGIRLDDKVNRIDGMLNDNVMLKNGEGLLDNLFDLAGYSVLAIRYLVDNKLISQDAVAKYFPTKKEAND